MLYEISEGMLPVLTLKLQKGEKVFTESGQMSWMDGNIKMETNTNGGLFKGLGRAFAGESIFMNTFTCEGNSGEIAFASSFPGQILEFDLAEGESIIAQKNAFMVAESTVDMKMHFRKKIGAGLFGGEGFIMQKITGKGKAFLEADGNVIKKEIKSGEVLIVDTGHILAISENIDIDIQVVKGVKNMLFGGEGIFVTKLTGNGYVYLQSMPISKLADTIIPYVPMQTN